ncbi:Acetylcholinesterase [Anopheles sinensis]|uniref:Acetylcholinesterase n=1 Tax=Anopheles sinensis TaxID=74873 RepID=A0A084WUA1_ANOSI|nr:Acetylcholinesterase [Anopheles sinensis]
MVPTSAARKLEFNQGKVKEIAKEWQGVKTSLGQEEYVIPFGPPSAPTALSCADEEPLDGRTVQSSARSYTGRPKPSGASKPKGRRDQ